MTENERNTFTSLLVGCGSALRDKLNEIYKGNSSMSIIGLRSLFSHRSARIFSPILSYENEIVYPVITKYRADVWRSIIWTGINLSCQPS